MTGAITARRVTWLTVALVACLLPLLVSDMVSGQASSRDQRRRTRFTPTTQVDPEAPSSIAPAAAPAAAPAGFSNLTNGFDPQGPDFNTLNEDTAVALRSFNDNRFTFEETETVADGLGPTYNAQSCRECHQNIVTGGASQVTVLRAGPLDRRTVLRVTGWVAHSVAGHASRRERKSHCRRQHPGVPDLAQHAGRRLRRSHLEYDAAQHPQRAAIDHARPCRGGAGTRGQRHRPDRPIRVEGTAREPRVVCRGCLSE